MVADILTIPINTWVSKVTLSGRIRVINPYDASLALEKIKILMCVGDWCRKLHGVKKRKNVTKKFNYYTQCEMFAICWNCTPTAIIQKSAKLWLQDKMKFYLWDAILYTKVSGRFFKI